jgi:hypothetical protein
LQIIEDRSTDPQSRIFNRESCETDLRLWWEGNLFISDFWSKLYKVYLPIQYADIISDIDIEEINNEKIWLNLVYRGISRDKTSILEIT